MIAKKVAIIGAGQAGLVSTKYALEHGLEPTVFEISSQIGGLWSSKRSIWDGLYSNISRYTEQFSDHPWDNDSLIFPSAKDINNYLKSYAQKFSLNKYIRFSNQVDLLEPKIIDSKQKWIINSRNIINFEKNSETFDYVMIASGLHSQPRTPSIENMETFRGLKLHSSKFRLLDPQLKSKSVAVIGCSLSAAEIASKLVGHASRVINIFRRPYLISPRLLSWKTSSENSYNILPIDLYFNRRFLTYPPKEFTKEQIKKFKIDFLTETFPLQTNKDLCHPALYVDLNNPKQEVLISISDDYMTHVKNKSIIPIRSEIKKFESFDSIRLADDSVINNLDAIIFCTGYDPTCQYFLNQSILRKLNFDASQHKHALMLYKCTFHPQAENLALIGQQDGLFFNGAELQAKWASMVFSDKIKLPSSDAMMEYIRNQVKRREQSRRPQYPYGSHVSLSDSIAAEMNLLPDFDEIRKENFKLYKMFWENSMFSAHFLFKEKRDLAIVLMNKMDLLNRRIYDLNDNRSFDSNYLKMKFSKFYNMPIDNTLANEIFSETY